LRTITIYTNENQLIRKAANGNREAQKRLYARFAPKMLSVCRQYITDIHFAEDVMVIGFVKVFHYLYTFKFEGSFEGWIRRIMIRESITFLRKRQFVVFDDELCDRNGHLTVSNFNEIDVEYIQILIDGLPQGYKLVFVLYAIEGYSHQEVANLLGITESTSKSQLYKARKLLQKQLKNQNIIGYGNR
jgi:RNA polymerase sigma-70 factor (ECF subfamily)